MNKKLKLLADWFDERIGSREIKKIIFDRKIPAGVGILYVLGSVSLFLFISQFLTGVLLAMSYSPSPDHAYLSVKYITEHIPMGEFIRGIHKWGASFMVIAVMLHMIRVFFMGSYKYPREATWVVGVFIFLIVIGFGFTGYLLPWDQRGYWATVVGANIAASAPLAGKSIAMLLTGGEGLGAVTLTRFYAIHVLVLPALLVGLVAVHLFLVIKQGISAPPERQKKEPHD